MIEPSGRTNRRPAFGYPAKDQRELAAECRRLKSMLVADKRSLPEISSCAHVAALREGYLPLVKRPDPLICAQTERGFLRRPHFSSIKRAEVKMDNGFDRAVRVLYGGTSAAALELAGHA
jgi:hypothetical protein